MVFGDTWADVFQTHICLALIGVCTMLFFGAQTAETVLASSISQYSDTISDSAPSEISNHTVQFTTTVAIPAGGYVRFIPEAGDFTIPAANFDSDNVELLVSTGSGYVLRSSSSTVSATDDGVTITTGTSGQVEVTLNSTTGIPAGASVQMLIGNQTSLATTTDVGLTNPSATGTYQYLIETGGGTPSSVGGLIAIIDSVYLPDVDTTETVPPGRYNGAPSGTLSGTSLSVEVSLNTDEFARCRYSTASGTAYFSMTNEFSGTSFRTVHTADVAVATSSSYTFYIRCIDDEGNFNIDDFSISFSIPEYPDGVPGSDGTEEGEGAGTGEGDGEADPGVGDPSGGDDTSGGTSGGGGGGGGGGGSGVSSGGSDGGGGFEGADRPYQSGDGRVIVNGFAFPRSSVVILIDGAIAERVTADGTGDFTATIDAIASGPYTFGVYAIDANGVRSSTFSTTFSVTGSRGSTLSNINVMPSVSVSPDPVDPGDTLTVSGYSVPNAIVTIENQNDKSSISLKTFTTTSDSRGEWSLEIDTNGFTTGTYKVRAKAKQEADDLVSTSYSDFTYYGVGEQAAVPQSSDLNRDGSVNLIDFSILLFWWNTDGGTSNPPADINQDGNVSLTDFSIMIFNWTG